MYAWKIINHMGSAGGGFDSLAGMRELFSNDFLLFAGWGQYLASVCAGSANSFLLMLTEYMAASILGAEC